MWACHAKPGTQQAPRNGLMRPALTSQEPVVHTDVGTEELHRQQAELVEGARRPVLPNAEGEASLRKAQLLGFEGATHWEGGVHEGEVHAGTAWPLALALTQGCGRQKDMEVDGEQGEAAICRERNQAQSGVSHNYQVVRNRMGWGRNSRVGVKPSPHCGPEGSAGLSA